MTPQNPAERMLCKTLILTWQFYARGALYALGPVLAWVIGGIALLSLYFGPAMPADLRATGPVPLVVWAWFAGMFILLVALWVGHSFGDLVRDSRSSLRSAGPRRHILKATYTLRTLTLGALMQSAAAFPAMSFTASADDKTQGTMLKTADEALATITGVQAARMALFQNDLTQAKAKVEAARTALMEAEADLTSKMMKNFNLADSKTNFLPFDMPMSLTEGFKATEENKLALQKAYGLFESAAPDDAIEVLRVASIDIQVSAGMLPYHTTLTALDNAIGNIEDGDYFDANLDLKEITDSVVVRQFGIEAIPVQGDVM